MDKIVFIYGLVDPITNELRYIGKSINPKVRLRKHISERSIHDSYKDRWLRKIINLGVKPELIIIDEVLITNWQFWESHYIGYYKSLGCKLTNGTNGGDEPPSTKGRKHTAEAKLKMSNTKKGKPIPWLNNGVERSNEHKSNLSKSLRGRVSPNKGEKFSEEYRKKLSDAHKWQQGENHPMFGKKHSEETKTKLSKYFSKSVLQFSLNGVFIKEFESAKAAEIETGISSNIIKNICLNKRKKNGNFKWVYKK
jgi:group I intron endonuclease